MYPLSSYSASPCLALSYPIPRFTALHSRIPFRESLPRTLSLVASLCLAFPSYSASQPPPGRSIYGRRTHTPTPPLQRRLRATDGEEVPLTTSSDIAWVLLFAENTVTIKNEKLKFLRHYMCNFFLVVTETQWNFYKFLKKCFRAAKRFLRLGNKNGFAIYSVGALYGDLNLNHFSPFA